MGNCCSSDATGNPDPYAIPKPEFQPAAQVVSPQQPKDSAQTARSISAEPPVPVEPTSPVTPSLEVCVPCDVQKPAPSEELAAPSKQTPPPANAAPSTDDYADSPVPPATPAVDAMTNSSSNESSDVASSNHKHKHHKTKPHHPKHILDTGITQLVQFRNEEIDAYYKRGKQLGSGAFATVFIGIHRVTHMKFAIKQVDRTKMHWGYRDALQDEIQNLVHVKGGPNIVQLFEVYTPNTRDCYLVMEVLQGGELFDRILEKRTFTEREARNVTKGLLNALHYMHSKRIAHRDLKPENLLLKSKLSDTDIKLADFGFAKKVKNYNGCRTLCGTPGYLAPEILERFPAYDIKCDLWSVGVILFLLLGGYLPFDGDSEDVVFDRTRNAQYDFYPDYWRQVSSLAKNLVVSLLTLNPAKRMSAERALNHEWMKQGDEALARRKLSVAHLQQSIRAVKQPKSTITAANHSLATVDRIKHLNEAFNSYITKCDDDTATVFTVATAKNIKPVPKPDSAEGLPFKQFYQVRETLGEGGFGVVKRAEHRKTKEFRAVKIVDTTRLERHGKAALKDEIAALKLLRGGPHIVRLFDVFEEQRYTYIVMEEMKGGELLRRIVDKEVYTEREARAVCKILFAAVDYCHKKKIAHRDLKPENLLLANMDDDTSIKIADFGFAKKVRKPNCLSTLCGSASYVAPEVLDLTMTGYDERADIWSCGVIMYVLLGGYAPFDAPVDELPNLILRGEYEFHDRFWRDTSASAKDLISSCLQVNPNIRITAEEALVSDWMTVESETLSGNDLTVAQEQIRKALPIEKLKGAIYTIMLTNKFTSLGDTFAGTLGTRKRRKPSIDESSSNARKTIEDSSSGKLFCQFYTLGPPLVNGSGLVLHEAIQAQSGEEVAVKVVDRRNLNPEDAVALQDEIIALKEVAACPYIVELYDVFEEPDTTFLVMERMRGGDLIERIITKSHYTEADAKAVCQNLLLGIQYCHSRSIAIRNIKPESILLSSDSDVDVKLSDLGYAKKVLYPNSLRTQCGTEGYTAPEILEHRPEYDVGCDMWSLGVVLYILIGGYRPFRGTGTEIMRQIRYGEYKFHERYWSHVSKEAKDLIRQMMTVDPNERISASEALESKWIMAEDSTLTSDLRRNQDGLKSFKAKAKIRQVGQMMIAVNKIQVLAESYRTLDEEF